MYVGFIIIIILENSLNG